MNLTTDERAALTAYAARRRADLTATRLGEIRTKLTAAGLLRNCSHAVSPMFVAVTSAGHAALAATNQPATPVQLALFDT